jgi:putative hemolysin
MYANKFQSFVMIALLALIISSCSPDAPETPVQTSSAPSQATPSGDANMPNPASVYCEDQGYTVEIRTAEDGSQSGQCVFSPGDSCDEWAYYRGECGPSGSAAESIPEDVISARDAALAYVSAQYSDQAPAQDLAWKGEITTPADLVGAVWYRFTSGDWSMEIVAPVVAPENVVYHVSLANSAKGFSWQGDVDRYRGVTETEP